MSTVGWSLLAQDGTITKGKGTRPPPGWFNDVRASVGLALLVPGYPPLYAVRPVCSNDVERGVGVGELARFWGVFPEPSAQVWLYPDASLIGIGKDTNEVQRLILAFQGKLEAERVVGATADQRDRP